MLRSLLILLVLPIAGCSVSRDDSAMPLVSQRDVKRHLVDRQILGNSGQVFRLTRDGDLVGQWDHHALLGSYDMRDGYFCRTLSAGPHGPLPEECQLIVLQGETLIITRARGAGESMIFRLE